jgi:cell division initiation protein
VKLSPLDIEHMEFSGSLGGYGKRQVREFLERVSQQFEETLRENQSLRDELKKRDERIEELQVGEVELKRAVIAAERIANEIKENARQEASLIVREAEGQRTAMLRDAETRLRSARAELSRLEREQQLFREQFRGFLQAFERSLDNPEVRRPRPADGAARQPEGPAQPRPPASGSPTESK